MMIPSGGVGPFIDAHAPVQLTLPATIRLEATPIGDDDDDVDEEALTAPCGGLYEATAIAKGVGDRNFLDEVRTEPDEL
jgi:hypothetical protein